MPPPAPSSLDGADKRDLRGSDESSSSILCITYMATAILPSSTIFGTDFSVLTEILIQMMPKTRRQIAGRRAGKGRVSRTRRLRAAVRNCTRDEGGPFEAGSQVQVSRHRELLSSRAMVVLCQEGARAPCCTRDEGGPFGAVL